MARPAARPLALVLAAGLALAACGSGESILDAGLDPETPATDASGSTEAPTTTATPLADLPGCDTAALDDASGTVNLTFWHGMNGGLQDALVSLTNEYNASQAKVKVTLQNQGGYEQVIDKYLQSSQGSRPDLAQFPEYAVQTIRDTDSVVPVGACIEDGGYDTSDLLAQALNQYSTEGVQWSMPFNVSDPVLYYNAKMFEQAGLDPADPPLTLEDLRNASQAIVDSGAAKYGLAIDTGADSGGGWFLEQWFAKADEFYADNDNGRIAPATSVLYDDQLGVELLSFLQGMVNDSLAVNVGDNPSGQDALLKLADPAAPAAMTIATSAALGTVLTTVDAGLIPGITSDQIGIGPMPGPSDVPSAIVGGASLWIMDGDPAKAAAAWDYVQFLVSPQSQSTWAAATGYVPVSEAAVEVDPLAARYTDDPRFAVAYDQLLSTPQRPTSVGPILGPQREVRNVTARAVASVLGGAPVEPTLAQAATQADSLIQDYNRRNR